MAAPFDRDAYYPLKAFAFEQITVSTTSVGFTAGTVSPADGTQRAIAAYVQVENAALRHRIDADPTAAVGHFAEPGDGFWVWGSADVDSIEFIRRDGVDAQINVTYYR